jgi:glutaredoxin
VPLLLRLYSRPDCHLCDEMKSVLATVAPEFGALIEEINIESDPALEARYGQEIPVLFINDRKAFKYRVAVRELRRRLEHERYAGNVR